MCGPVRRKKDWREQSRRVYEQIIRAVPDAEEEVLGQAPPWRWGVPGTVVIADTDKTRMEKEQRRAAEEAVDRVSVVDLTIYTDGAVEGGMGRGGAGVLILEGQEVRHMWSAPAGAACSSYAAELTAMCEAVEWIGRREDEWTTASIITDSRSLLDALQGSGGESILRRLRERLWRFDESAQRVTLVWVPGHCGLPGNEEADRLAGQGCGLKQGDVELDGATRRAMIRKIIKSLK